MISRRNFLRTVGIGFASAAIGGCSNPSRQKSTKEPSQRPNILFCISDDQSWAHTGFAGCKTVNTPNFDRIAREGAYFSHAFCAAPSCTPSRGSILTGQEMWRLEQGGVLRGALPRRYEVYPSLLEAAGYYVGYVDKGWGPGDYKPGGWEHNPAGPRKYYSHLIEPRINRISKIDYAANFQEYLNEVPQGKPFCFWFGCKEPHRGYDKDSGLRARKKIKDVKVPAFLPDTIEIRSDLLDYFVEIEWFDRHLGRMIDLLEQRGTLDNTIVVVTSDNGMPFPRAKANLYDYGTRMPLAVRWGAQVKGGLVIDDFVSLTDIAPTFLEAAGIEVPSEMTGRSFMDVLLSDASGRIDDSRDQVFTGIERHARCRQDGPGYPSRAIRTHRWLYIRNYEPQRWPAGDPHPGPSNKREYGDIDDSPTKTFMIGNRRNPNVAPFFHLGFGKRPAEELYDVENDPDQVRNLASNEVFAEIKKKLQNQLEDYSRKTKDPRTDGRTPWDDY
jgi:uncharacterized sulfatase